MQFISSVFLYPYFKPLNPALTNISILICLTIFFKQILIQNYQSRAMLVVYGINGNKFWEACYNGPGNHLDHASAITIGPSGNIYVTGSSKNSWSHNVYVYDCVTVPIVKGPGYRMGRPYTHYMPLTILLDSFTKKG